MENRLGKERVDGEFLRNSGVESIPDHNRRDEEQTGFSNLVNKHRWVSVDDSLVSPSPECVSEATAALLRRRVKFKTLRSRSQNCLSLCSIPENSQISSNFISRPSSASSSHDFVSKCPESISVRPELSAEEEEEECTRVFHRSPVSFENGYKRVVPKKVVTLIEKPVIWDDSGETLYEKEVVISRNGLALECAERLCSTTILMGEILLFVTTLTLLFISAFLLLHQW